MEVVRSCLWVPALKKYLGKLFLPVINYTYRKLELTSFLYAINLKDVDFLFVKIGKETNKYSVFAYKNLKRTVWAKIINYVQKEGELFSKRVCPMAQTTSIIQTLIC